MTPPAEGGSEAAGVAEHKYGPGFLHEGKEREKLLAYPATKAGSPIVVYFHGGWWHADAEKAGEFPEFQDQSIAKKLRAAGYAVCLANYIEDLDKPAESGSGYSANATGHINAFPAQPECMLRAAEWAVGHAAELNGDATKLVIMGGSSGANIALLGAQLINKEKPGLAKACCAFSAPTNLLTLWEWSVKGQEEKVKTSQEESAHQVAVAIGAKDAEMPNPTVAGSTTTSAGSPALHVTSAMPPTFLTGGEAETIVGFFQQTEMMEALAAQGIARELKAHAGAGHSIGAWEGFAETMYAFLHAHGV